MEVEVEVAIADYEKELSELLNFLRKRKKVSLLALSEQTGLTRQTVKTMFDGKIGNFKSFLLVLNALDAEILIKL